MPSTRTILGLAAAATAGWALSRMSARPRDAGDGNFVRDAGPKEMRDPPREWDRVDEQVDESFPASDPPATY
ncbi:hypothetical protein OG2516_12141 [Oceanicola granulosus HTCC2516]|uniref:Uncharacterized protein n=1 Tax=Oceanicola granulosus (strain ATCC BAA-861 / DSM 15982 / KCTC 12143 / HTCC2516) TaxID=314256 RepID=Q2CD80_OCEGH|nr:hypothetical protein [Oceanicola granulosus]EAR50598.1 hypothetical protein OG2516_12141 [Oceanicola granulosus HTCC2516]